MVFPNLGGGDLGRIPTFSRFFSSGNVPKWRVDNVKHLWKIFADQWSSSSKDCLGLQLLASSLDHSAQVSLGWQQSVLTKSDGLGGKMIFRSHFLYMKYILHPSLLCHQLPCGSDFGGLHKVEYLTIEHGKSRKANENGIHRFIFRPCISIQDSNSPLVLKVSDKNTNLKENTTNRNI